MVGTGNPSAEAHARALEQHVLFETADLDEARDRVAGVFCPHDLRPAGRYSGRTRMSHVPLGGVSVNRLRYGTAVRIDAGRLHDFHLVMMPVTGRSDVRCGSDVVESDAATGTVVAPTQPLRMHSDAACDQVMVRIDRALIEHHCAMHLGYLLDRPLEFRLDLNMTADSSAPWRRLMGYLLSEIANGTLESPLLRPPLENMVVSTLLFCQPHTYTAELVRPAPSIAPGFVCRAQAYMRRNAEKPITPIDLARVTGVSTRALYAGFQNFLGVSPMVYLKSVRLEKAHAALAAASPDGETVTNVALRWGFNHLGRFTADYKRRYGQLPSDTLRGRRLVACGGAPPPLGDGDDTSAGEGPHG